MRVLIAYGSAGGTAGLAAIVGDEFTTLGLQASAEPARKVRRLDGYDAVVIAGALYANRWHRDARRFARRHAKALRERPVWPGQRPTRRVGGRGGHSARQARGVCDGRDPCPWPGHRLAAVSNLTPKASRPVPWPRTAQVTGAILPTSVAGHRKLARPRASRPSHLSTEQLTTFGEAEAVTVVADDVRTIRESRRDRDPGPPKRSPRRSRSRPKVRRHRLTVKSPACSEGVARSAMPHPGRRNARRRGSCTRPERRPSACTGSAAADSCGTRRTAAGCALTSPPSGGSPDRSAASSSATSKTVDLVTLAMNGSDEASAWWLNLEARPDAVIRCRTGNRARYAPTCRRARNVIGCGSAGSRPIRGSARVRWAVNRDAGDRPRTRNPTA